MRTVLSTLRKIVLLVTFATMYGSTSHAAIYTAVVSGSFSAGATWGGVAPASLLTSDVIIIPAGITVNLASDETISGTAALMVDGALTTSTSGAALIITSGGLSGTGSITVDSLALGLTSGFSYTGTIVANSLTSLGTTISTGANITVSSDLNLMSGSLTLSGGSLTLSSGATVNVTGGTIAVSGGTLDLHNPYDVNYSVASSIYGGLELHGSGLRNVTVNVPGTVTLSADDTVAGTLTLAGGSLVLNGHTLTLSGSANLAAGGSGTLTGSATSGLTINTTGSLSGTLNFAAGGNTLQNLTLNASMGSDSVSLGSDLTVTGTLALNSGRISLGSHNLTLGAGASVSGGSANSYVVTGGSGSLVMNLVASASDSFHVGTTTNYAPMVVAAASGSATGNVSVNVSNGVLSAGTTGTLVSSTEPLVNATWNVSSTATAAINYTLTAMWSAAMEVNAFNRASSFISHFHAGAWDSTAVSAATPVGSMYAQTRAGITSLSPFTVANREPATTLTNSIANNGTGVTVYPNPVSDVIYYSAATPIQRTTLYDVCGKVLATDNNPSGTIDVHALPAGVYLVKFSYSGANEIRRFTKN